LSFYVSLLRNFGFGFRLLGFRLRRIGKLLSFLGQPERAQLFGPMSAAAISAIALMPSTSWVRLRCSRISFISAGLFGSSFILYLWNLDACRRGDLWPRITMDRAYEGANLG